MSLVDRLTPLPPEVLVSALQDRVHPASGRLLGVTPIRLSSHHDPHALRAMLAHVGSAVRLPLRERMT